MLSAPTPMSNAARQRLFRRRHPNYYADIQARKRAADARAAQALRLQLQAKFHAELAAQQAQLPHPFPSSPPAQGDVPELPTPPAAGAGGAAGASDIELVNAEPAADPAAIPASQ